MVGVCAVKTFSAVPTPLFVIVSDGALVGINVLKGFGERSTRKVVGDAKCTNSFNEFLDDGTGGETMADANGLCVGIISWWRIVI